MLRCLVVLLLSSFCLPTSHARQPNIVFLLVDDLGWGALGAYGSSTHDTPNFDELCARGMRFSNAYAACTVCSPSRAALLTGRYPARTHLTDWIPGHENPNAALQIPAWSREIDTTLTTLPEAFRAGGYQTWFLGKWHLEPIYGDWSREKTALEQAKHTPQAHGFDVNIAGREWGQPKGRGKYFYPFDMPGIESGEQGEYLTDRLTDEALALIDGAGERPFLLYLSYYTVHGPLMGKPEYVAHYREELSKSGDETQLNARANYAAMHRSLDDSVGRITAKLADLGLTDDTIIVFTGDNGGDRHDACGGLRGRKGTAFEGGVREPTCVVWPGTVAPGSQSDTPIIGMDFFPTLLSMAGLDALPDQHVDGVDLSPLLNQTGELPPRNLFWHYPHYHRTTPYSSVRSGDWKLIEFAEQAEPMLFDLAADPHEAHDLAGQRPDKAAELRATLDKWRRTVNAQTPTHKESTSPPAPARPAT